MTRLQQGQRVLPARTLSRNSRKRKQALRLMALLLLFGGMLGGIIRPAAAHAEPQRIDGNTYNGLDYGWSLTWDEDVWGEPTDEHVDGTEYVSINTIGEPFAASRIVATNAFDGDVNACVTGWEDFLRNAGSLRHIEATDVENGIDLPRDAAEGAYSYDIKVDGTLVAFVEYVQCRPLSDGVNLVLTLSAMPSDYDDALPLFADLAGGISLGDNESASSTTNSDSETGARPSNDPNASDDSSHGDNEADASDVPGGTGVDGNSYTSVNFDWSIEWDGRVWKASPGMEDNSGGHDFVTVESTKLFGAPMMLVTFETSVRYDGDVEACAAGAYDALTEDDDGTVTNVAEANVELPDVPRNGATGAYRYTYAEGNDEPMNFVDVRVCLPLDNLGATLQVTILIPPDIYEDALPYFNDLIAAIEINLD